MGVARSPRFDVRSESVPRRLRWILLAGIGVLAFSRAPYLLVQGRFWAEEATLHFRHVRSNGLLSGLTFFAAHTGYYNLYANIAAGFASLVPLRYAPLVTAWCCLALVLLIAWIALAWPSDLLPNAGAKVATAVVVVVGTLAAPEVWLNSINAMSYLGIAALLLAFVRVEDLAPRRYLVAVATLAVAGLSGLYAVALTPLFVVQAILHRSRRRVGLAAVLTATAIAQVVVHLASRASGNVDGSRLAAPSIRSLVSSVSRLQFSGLVLPQRVIDEFAGPMRLAGIAIALALVALVAVLLWSAPSRRVGLLLVAAFALVEVLVQMGALDGQVSGRYTVVPVAILTLLVIHGVAVSTNTRAVRVGLAVGIVILVVGLADFWVVEPNLLRCRDCPEWAPQIATYEAGGSERIEVWPYDRDEPWILRLPALSRGS